MRVESRAQASHRLFIQEIKYGTLLALLVGLVLAAPLLSARGLHVVNVLVISVVLGVNLWIAAQRRAQFVIMAALTSCWLLEMCSLHLLGQRWLGAWGVLPGGLAFGYGASVLLRDVLSQERVTVDTILGSACIYLMIGVTFALLFQAVSMVVPDAFMYQGSLFVQDPAAAFDQRFLYFSFVTMTTLGYGDMTPNDEFAGSLAALEAMTGVLFIATLVARLVTMYEPRRRAAG